MHSLARTVLIVLRGVPFNFEFFSPYGYLSVILSILLRCFCRALAALFFPMTLRAAFEVLLSSLSRKTCLISGCSSIKPTYIFTCSPSMRIYVHVEARSHTLQSSFLLTTRATAISK